MPNSNNPPQPKKPRTPRHHSSSSTSHAAELFSTIPSANLGQFAPRSAIPEASSSSVARGVYEASTRFSSHPVTFTRPAPQAYMPLPPPSYVTGSLGPHPLSFARRAPIVKPTGLQLLSSVASGQTGIGTAPTTTQLGPKPVKFFQGDMRLAQAILHDDIEMIIHLVIIGVSLHEEYPDGSLLDYVIRNKRERDKKDAIISIIFRLGFNIFNTQVSSCVLAELNYRATNNMHILSGLAADKTPLPMPFGCDPVGKFILKAAALGNHVPRITFESYSQPAIKRWLDAPVKYLQIREYMAQVARVCRAAWQLSAPVEHLQIREYLAQAAIVRQAAKELSAASSTQLPAKEHVPLISQSGQSERRSWSPRLVDNLNNRELSQSDSDDSSLSDSSGNEDFHHSATCEDKPSAGYYG